MIMNFGKLKDGRQASLHILRNAAGIEAHVTDYGAALVRLLVPDRDGNMRDVVLGHDDVSGYENGSGSVGATVGRFANRIGGAAFTIDGKEYHLTANNGPNALHGGRDFYTKRLWQSRIPFVKTSARSIANAYATESLNDDWQSFDQFSMTGNTVTFCLDSPDGDQGFPGNLHVEVTYTLSNDNELHIDYKAVSDADTPLNLTNHSYFNLSGHDSGSVLLQLCEINADYVTDTDENNLPTGSMLDVSGTPMDFRQGKALGTDISADFKLIKIGSGYDHNYVLNGSGYRKVASLWSEDSGICMAVHTDLPGLQLYTANHLNDTGKNSTFYTPQCAVCFESQFFPDAVNHEDFPGGILKAGEEFTSRTTYKF